MGRYLRPWWVGCRWAVEALCTDGQWREIYHAATRADARRDAQGWREQMGQQVRVVPGPGHKSRRCGTVVHERDEDCTVGDDGLCSGCGVHHADPCHECGKRALHSDGCSEIG